METYNNENDQVDALKRFFAENGKALAVGVILGIGALVGWRYWSSHQQDTARESSLAYENTISALKSDKPEAIGSAEKFAADSKTAMARLLLWSWPSVLSIRTICKMPKSSFSRAWPPRRMIT